VLVSALARKRHIKFGTRVSFICHVGLLLNYACMEEENKRAIMICLMRDPVLSQKLLELQALISRPSQVFKRSYLCVSIMEILALVN
jgi:hypothetical protein